MGRTSKQKTNRETMNLSDVISQMNLTDIYRTFHLKTKEYTFYSATRMTFSTTDHIIRHKASFSRNKKIKITVHIY
jgi:exonuclease III